MALTDQFTGRYTIDTEGIVPIGYVRKWASTRTSAASARTQREAEVTMGDKHTF